MSSDCDVWVGPSGPCRVPLAQVLIGTSVKTRAERVAQSFFEDSVKGEKVSGEGTEKRVREGEKRRRKEVSGGEVRNEK